MDLTVCPICAIGIDANTQIRKKPNESLDISCRRCGDFNIAEEMLRYDDMKSKIQNNRSRISGLIRYYSDNNIQKSSISPITIDELISNSLIPNKNDIEIKSKFLLQYLKGKTNYFGEEINIYPQKDFPIAFAENESEFRSLSSLLADKGYVNSNYEISGIAALTLTEKGFSLDNKLVKSNQVFIAIQFNDFSNELIKSEERIKTIEQAIRDTGYEPKCIKKEHYPDTILNKGLGEIRKSKFIIADLTNMRPAVLYESGFSAGLNIPIIFIQNSNDQTDKEFYTSNYKINFYKDLQELEQVIISSIKAQFP